MLKTNRIRLFLVALALVVAVGILPTARTTVSQAQDDAPLVCDSTLMLLLYIAEHDYDYLSGFMMNQAEAMRPIDYGQYTPLIQETMAMMTAMMEEATEEEMMAMESMEAMVAPMMEMSLQELTDAYMAGMAMDATDLSTFTQLPAGVVADEDPACTALRANVEQFILAHILAESQMMMMETAQ